MAVDRKVPGTPASRRHVRHGPRHLDRSGRQPVGTRSALPEAQSPGTRRPRRPSRPRPAARRRRAPPSCASDRRRPPPAALVRRQRIRGRRPDSAACGRVVPDGRRPTDRPGPRCCSALGPGSGTPWPPPGCCPSRSWPWCAVSASASTPVQRGGLLGPLDAVARAIGCVPVSAGAAQVTSCIRLSGPGAAASDRRAPPAPAASPPWSHTDRRRSAPPLRPPTAPAPGIGTPCFLPPRCRCGSARPPPGPSPSTVTRSPPPSAATAR